MPLRRPSPPRPHVRPLLRGNESQPNQVSTFTLTEGYPAQMANGMGFEDARHYFGAIRDALSASPTGLGEEHERVRQDLFLRMDAAAAKFAEIEVSFVPRSLFAVEEYELVLEGLGGSTQNRTAYAAVLRSDGNRIKRFISDIELWVDEHHEHFVVGSHPLPGTRPDGDTLIRVTDDILSIREKLTAVIDRAVDADNPCYEILREWSALIGSRLQEYRAYPIEDIYDSYGYLAAQIEHLGVIASTVGAPEDMLTVIANLMDEVGGPWRGRG